MKTASDVTLVKNGIHNPKEPRHFMRIHPVDQVVTIRLGERVLARSENALRLQEVGGDLYEPVLYLPRSDVLVSLSNSEKSTVCPLKGRARYLSLMTEDGALEKTDIAWCYDETHDFADEIKGLIAFVSDQVTIELRPPNLT